MNPEKKSLQLHGLDHLRALAITMVFFCHYQLDIFGHPTWLHHAGFGWTGVDLFFVLSGFLISSQLFAAIRAGKGVNYKTFFLKRTFRILPAFWAVIALYFLIPVFGEETALPPLYKLLTFTHNFGLNVLRTNAFAHAWSLCVEEHFYFALPIALIMLHKFRLLHVGPWLIVLLFVAGFFIRGYCWAGLHLPLSVTGPNAVTWFQHIYYPTYCRLDGLLTGVAIAAVYVFAPQLWQRIARYGNLFLLIGISMLAIAWITCSGPSRNLSIFGFPLIASAFGCMVISAVSPSSVLYRLRSRVTALIATLSYGIYLLHKGAIHVTQLAAAKLGLDTGSVFMLLLCMAACVLMALALYYLVERPFMQLRDRVLRRTPRREPAPEGDAGELPALVD